MAKPQIVFCAKKNLVFFVGSTIAEVADLWFAVNALLIECTCMVTRIRESVCVKLVQLHEESELKNSKSVEFLSRKETLEDMENQWWQILT